MFDGNQPDDGESFFNRLDRKTSKLSLVLIVPIVAILPSCNEKQGSIVSFLNKLELLEHREIFQLRRDPIVISTVGLDSEAYEQVANVVSIYAAATSLPISESREKSNFIVIRTKEVSKGNKVNSDVLGYYGFEKNIISLMEETEGWSVGCNVGVFGSKKTGNIILSLALIDESLNADIQKKCIYNLMIQSFGIGLGRNEPVPEAYNYYKYAYVLNIVSRCDRENGSGSIEAVEDCIAKEARSLDLSH